MTLPTLAPIVDYQTLLNAIAVWVDRSDFVNVTPVLVGLAHARMNRTLRVQDMLVRSTSSVTVGTEYVDLPGDYIEMKRIRPVTSPPSRPLTVMTMDQAAERLAENGIASRVPTSYSLVGGSVEFAPAATGDFNLEMLYYGMVPSLSADAPTNWIVAKWPEAYLYGALVESAPYIRDDDRMQMWKDRFEEILNEIQAASDRSTLAGGRMVNRTGPLA